MTSSSSTRPTAAPRSIPAMPAVSATGGPASARTASALAIGPANVEACAPRGPGALSLRVHERGVGETLACGTGSCAAVAAAIARGDVTSDTVRVAMPGGTLVVRPRGDRYQLAGP